MQVESKVMKFAQKAVNKGKEVYKDVQKSGLPQEADQFFLSAEKKIEKGIQKGVKKAEEKMQYVEQNGPQMLKDSAKAVGGFFKGLFS